MRKIIVVDVDGTMTLVGDRVKHITNGNNDYKSFYEACDEDQPNMPVVDLVNLLALKFDIVFITGRRNTPLVREKTIQQLQAFCNFPVANRDLMMRPEGNERHDIEVKPALLNEWLSKGVRRSNEIEFFLEDRASMTEAWRKLGYTVFQVAEGNF